MHRTLPTGAYGMGNNPHWSDQVEEHDFAAAEDYLSLVIASSLAEEASKALRAASPQTRKAKDLLRAAALPLLPIAHEHVANDLKKVRDGKPLSPVLLVRGNAAASMPLIIADGYHRVCASTYLDEDLEVPCRIVDLNDAGSTYR
ncbi:MAG: hypothetical protein NVSMB57_05060 [Actinomycetota bacterium]